MASGRNGLRIVWVLAWAAMTLAGCGESRRAEDLEKELQAARQENEDLRRQLAEERKRIEQVLANAAALGPKVAQLESELEAARASLARVAATTASGMSERAREEIRRIVQEMLDAQEESRADEQRAWLADLRSRHLDELVAAAHLSPEQKEKLKAYEEEEQQALRSAYIAARANAPRGAPVVGESLEKARERIRLEKENKIKALLDAEQYQKYLEWKRQGIDPFRAGINRRQQSPNANQKDM